MTFSSAAPPDMMRPELELELWSDYRVRGSLAARESLFAMHADFARSIARRHHRQHGSGRLDIVELRQLAYAGLLEAMERFDPTRGIPFRGFAARRIAGSILDGISKMDERSEQLSWRQRVRRDRMQSLMHDDKADEKAQDPLATLVDLAVGLALGFMLEGTGMIALPDADILHAVGPQRNAYESAAWNEMVGRLKTEITTLSDREQLVLRHHYADGLAFDTLAELLNLSKARVSQIHRGALERLRKRLSVQGHFKMDR